jgi:hypothetical protein
MVYTLLLARFASLRAKRSNRSEAEFNEVNPATHALRCIARISGLATPSSAALRLLRFAYNDEIVLGVLLAHYKLPPV